MSTKLALALEQAKQWRAEFYKAKREEQEEKKERTAKMRDCLVDFVELVNLELQRQIAQIYPEVLSPLELQKDEVNGLPIYQWQLSLPGFKPIYLYVSARSGFPDE